MMKQPHAFAAAFCALTVTASGAWAQAQDCSGLSTSNAAAPASLAATCGAATPATPAPLDPSDMAFGADGILQSCSTLTLNDPVNTNPFGFLPDLRPGCDFRGNDFTTFYCTDFGAPATLIAIDTETCTETVLGTLSNTQSVSGLAWDASTQTMFMSTTDVTTSELWTLDIDNVSSTFVGPMTDSPANISIAVSQSGDLFGHDIVTDGLHSIDKATGASSLIGPVGFDANFAQGFDCDDSDGTCYIFAFNNGTFATELWTVDLATGAGQFVGNIGADAFQEWTGAGVMTGGNGGGDAITGSVDGFDTLLAICRNITTGQDVRIPLQGATAFDCTANGLMVSPGDRVVLIVGGDAP